ncbi:PREDICTED: colipase-like protein 2 [Myotis davidii]|uniref:colipase-like protein 2 n=1 Tax=Myotis davidii TaxID=225400 RepID=UPI000767B208|nr:PREDICTED: colipase-like protein 2 [Myotis davidii]
MPGSSGLLFSHPGPWQEPSPPSPTAGELVTQGLSPQVDGAPCSHHSECFSDCCLMNLDNGGEFCAPRGRKAMVCLPQTKGAINFICPCRLGLSCIPQDPSCPRRCYLI